MTMSLSAQPIIASAFLGNLIKKVGSAVRAIAKRAAPILGATARRGPGK